MEKNFTRFNQFCLYNKKENMVSLEEKVIIYFDWIFESRLDNRSHNVMFDILDWYIIRQLYEIITY